LRDAITEQEVFEMSGHRVAKKTNDVVPTPTLLKSPHFNHICIYWQWLLNKWFEHTGTDRLRTIVCFRGTELSINLAQVMLVCESALSQNWNSPLCGPTHLIYVLSVLGEATWSPAKSWSIPTNSLSHDRLPHQCLHISNLFCTPLSVALRGELKSIIK